MADEPISLMTLDQVAERLHVSPRTLQDLLKIHPYYRRAGRRKLLTSEDFNALVAALPGGDQGRKARPAPPSDRALRDRADRLLAEPALGRRGKAKASKSGKVVSIRDAGRSRRRGA